MKKKKITQVFERAKYSGKLKKKPQTGQKKIKKEEKLSDKR